MLTEGDVSLTGVRFPVLPAAVRFTVTHPSAIAERPVARIVTWHWRAALITADLAAGAAGVLLAVLGRFGVTDPLGPTAPYVVLIAAGPLLWTALLLMGGAYEERRIGSGAAEFGRIATAGLWMLAAIIAASYLSHSELSREVTAVAVTAMTVVSLGVHLAGRLLLRLRLRGGAALHRIIVVGTGLETNSLVQHIARLPHAGLQVAGVCLADLSGTANGGSPRLSSTLDDVIQAARDAEADTIAVAGSGVLSGADLRRLSWDLEGTGIRLLVAPGVTELAGPRLLVHPLGGLPLLHVKEAGFNTPNRALKSVIDRVGAALLCAVLSPVFAAIALAVRLGGPGPVLFRQKRIGLHGLEFTILKFRTMVDGAHDQRHDLLDRNEHDGVLFKIRDDPRVTRVGRFLRRYSLDELPQLWNVLTGTMSLIGPRPPLRSEVDAYPTDLRRRRLLMKPGITGLWQVSGRSDLSWEETVRLDLQYVENWSVLLDATVLWKTFRAVVSGRGAY